MELRLTLTLRRGNLLPLNYQYPLSAWIYKVIERADAEFSHFLHEEGFRAGKRRFKMFTFSQLDLRPYEIQGGQIRLLGKSISLVVRFLIDSSMEHFVRGIFMEQRLGLGDRNATVDLEVSQVEMLPSPIFRPVMRYRCLSQICISRSRADGTTEYLSPEHPAYGQMMIQNLAYKAGALANAVKESKQLAMPEGKFQLLNRPRKKGIHIKSGTPEATQVIGYLFHFELDVPAELHELGYYAGFGEKNSMGFGCVEVMHT